MKTIRESIAALGLLFTVGVVAIFYSRLPETIATHFNAAGVADGLVGGPHSGCSWGMRFFCTE